MKLTQISDFRLNKLHQKLTFCRILQKLSVIYGYSSFPFFVHFAFFSFSTPRMNNLDLWYLRGPISSDLSKVLAYSDQVQSSIIGIPLRNQSFCIIRTKFKIFILHKKCSSFYDFWYSGTIVPYIYNYV